LKELGVGNTGATGNNKPFALWSMISRSFFGFDGGIFAAGSGLFSADSGPVRKGPETAEYGCHSSFDLVLGRSSPVAVKHCISKRIKYLQYIQ
jgi:hypothetical protein